MIEDPESKIARLEAHARKILKHSGGEPSDMDVRLDHLEDRVDRIEGKLDTIIDRLGGIATKADTRTYLLTALGLFLAIVAILVASMGWLEGRASRIQPPPAAPATPMVFQITPAVPNDHTKQRSPGS